MPDVFTLLENDHRNVESMLEELAESSPGPEREQLVDKLAAALQLHMSFEEDSLHPLLIPLDGDPRGRGRGRTPPRPRRADEDGRAVGRSRLRDEPSTWSRRASAIMVQEEEHEAFPKLPFSVDDATSKQLTADLLERRRRPAPCPTTLRQTSKSDLLEMAAEAGIERRSSMTKDELVAALTAS